MCATVILLLLFSSIAKIQQQLSGRRTSSKKIKESRKKALQKERKRIKTLFHRHEELQRQKDKCLTVTINSKDLRNSKIKGKC